MDDMHLFVPLFNGLATKLRELIRVDFAMHYKVYTAIADQYCRELLRLSPEEAREIMATDEFKEHQEELQRQPREEEEAVPSTAHDPELMGWLSEFDV
jgi:hypothetical protein